MSEKPIVAATDGSEESLRAVDWAAREAVLRDAPLRIVSAAGLLPRMVGSKDHSEYETVSDVIRDENDYALTAATARAAKVAPDLLIDADHLDGGPADAVTAAGSGALMLVVDGQGVVESVRLQSPSNRYHDRFWVSAAKTWRFTPAMKDGQPVKFLKRIVITDPPPSDPQ